MKRIECDLPDSLYEALIERTNTDKTSCDHMVSLALSHCLCRPIHTLFQVSTSGVLVEGLYQGAVRIARLLRHGDFGLGTFIGLDGEMVVLEGACYRVASDGAVTSVEGERLIPYAVVTRFAAEFTKGSQQFKNLNDLVAICDALRSSENSFYAFRIEGKFSLVKTRIMKGVPRGTGLKSAFSGQTEFTFKDQKGTLIGLWSPGFAGSFSLPGYHFRFLSADRKRGGHVLECKAASATIGGCAMNEMHVSLPETSDFLKADLVRDAS